MSVTEGGKDGGGLEEGVGKHTFHLADQGDPLSWGDGTSVTTIYPYMKGGTEDVGVRWECRDPLGQAFYCQTRDAYDLHFVGAS